MTNNEDGKTGTGTVGISNDTEGKTGTGTFDSETEVNAQDIALTDSTTPHFDVSAELNDENEAGNPKESLQEDDSSLAPPNEYVALDTSKVKTDLTDAKPTSIAELKDVEGLQSDDGGEDSDSDDDSED